MGARSLEEQLALILDQIEVLETLQQRLEREGARRDRAVAEAVRIIDLGRLEETDADQGRGEGE